MRDIYSFPDSITDIYCQEIQIAESKSLQRNDEWFENRRGRFTGSKIKDLMSCTMSTSRLTWCAEKVIDFGETAKKYVFSRAKERQRKKVIRLDIGRNGEYGSNIESTIIELLKEKYPNSAIKEVGFIEFIEGIAGASPDGQFDNLALEIKAAIDWNGVYMRHEMPFDHKHQDFWQIQSEMLALKTDECMYVVAEPPENIKNPVIKDLSEIIVKSSPIHQNAIIQRCLIGDAAINLYLEGCNFQEAIIIACTEFKF